MTDILKHYGIKGMRWGVRRKRGPSGRVSSDYSKTRKLLKKKTSELSNEELRKITTRLSLERSVQNMNTSTVDKGKKAAAKVLKQYGNGVVGGLVGAASAATVAALIKRGG
jgi:hypothetical protein